MTQVTISDMINLAHYFASIKEPTPAEKQAAWIVRAEIVAIVDGMERRQSYRVPRDPPPPNPQPDDGRTL